MGRGFSPHSQAGVISGKKNGIKLELLLIWWIEWVSTRQDRLNQAECINVSKDQTKGKEGENRKEKEELFPGNDNHGYIEGYFLFVMITIAVYF